MIKVQLVKTEHCKNCDAVRQNFENLKDDFPGMSVEEIMMTTPKGMELAQKYTILASPGVIINGKLAFAGGANEKRVRKALEEATKYA